MRIAISTLIVRPGLSGSNESYLLNLVAALQTVDQENEYLLFVTPQNESLFPITNPRWRLVRVPALGYLRGLRILVDQFVLPLWAQRLKVDVLHYPGTVGSCLNLSRLRQVVTVHYDLDPKHTPSVSRLKRAYYGLLMRRSREIAKTLIVPSRSFAVTFGARWKIPAQKIQVIYHGVQMPPAFSDVTLEVQVLNTFGLQPGFVLSVTNALPHKNVPHLLEAYTRLATNRSDVGPLVLAGSITSHAVTQWQALLAEKGVIFPWNRLVLTGFIPPRHVAILYRNATVMVTSTLTESSSMPVLEAMANDCPVVASDIDVHLEIAQEAAVLVPCDSVGQLVTACARILDDPEWRQSLVQRGRERAESFSWLRAAAETVAAYQ